MSTINDSDLLLVERNGNLHQITYDQMSTLNDDDILLVERGGVQYKVEAQYVSTGANGLIIPPVEVLTPLNGSGITVFDQYEPLSSTITAVGEAGTITKNTDEIQSVADVSNWNQSQTWSNGAVAVNNTGGTPGSHSNGTYNFDNDITNWGSVVPNGTGIITWTYTFPTALTGVTSIRVYGYNGDSGGTTGNSYGVNSSSYQAGQGAGSTASWQDLTSLLTGTTVTQITGTFGVPTLPTVIRGLFQAIEINGKLLVDAGIAGATIIGKTLSFPTNTNFSGLSVGVLSRVVDDADGALVQDWNDNFHYAVASAGGNTLIPQNPNGVGTITNGVLAFDTDLSANRATTVDAQGYGYWLDIPEPFNATSVSVYTTTGGSQYSMYVEVIDDTGATVKQHFVDSSQTIHYFDVDTTSLSGKIVSIVAWMSNNRLTMWGYRALIDGVYRPFIDSSFRVTTTAITAINNIATSQQQVYATLNPLAKNSTVTLSNGNLNATSASWAWSTATIAVSSGKWYWELTRINAGADNIVSGIVKSSFSDFDYNFAPGGAAQSDIYAYTSLSGNKEGQGSSISYGDLYQAAGDVIGVALDMDAGTLTFYKNGVSQGQAFSGITDEVYPVWGGTGGTASAASLNFGATAFAYTPPTGYTGVSELVTTYPSVTVDGGTWDTSNQSQVWSNLVVGTLDTQYGNSNVAAPFDGSPGPDYSHGIRPAGNGNYLSMDFGTTFANATTLKIYGDTSLDGVTYIGTNENLEINGVPLTASEWADNGGVYGPSSATFTLSNGLTSLRWGYGSGSYSSGYIYILGIEVDGKLLVDPVEDSQVWSSYGSGSVGNPWTALFDGSTSTIGGNPNTGLVSQITFDTPITATSVRIYGQRGPSGASTFTINGGTNAASAFTTSIGWVDVTAYLPGNGEFTGFEKACFEYFCT